MYRFPFILCFYLMCLVFYRAKKELDDHVAVSHDWEDFCNKLDQKNLIMAPYCGECEETIKKDSAR